MYKRQGLVFGNMVGGLGGWLAEKHGWSDAYTYIGLPNLALAILLIIFLRDPPREHLTAAPVSAADLFGPATLNVAGWRVGGDL